VCAHTCTQILIMQSKYIYYISGNQAAFTHFMGPCLI